MAFYLYRSSAGSGKTYTLVKEYLKIVLQNPERFKNILAVTFTNKAAAEMKERIIEALHRLRQGEDAELEQVLSGELPGTIDIRGRSGEILTHILHHYTDFAIMTIDSFIHRVIKAFALEIGLPLNFGIDLNLARLETWVLEKMLSQVGQDKFITDVILRFVFSRVEDEKSWNIDGDIRRFEKEILNEKNIDRVKGLGAFGAGQFAALTGQLDDLRRVFIRQVRVEAQTALDLVERAGLSSDDFPYKERGILGTFQKCARLKERDLKEFTLGRRFLDGLWTSNSTEGAKKALIDGLLPGGLETARQRIMTIYETGRPAALTAAFVLENIYLGAIINHLQNLIEDYKKQNNVIPIAEFNIRVNEIVNNSPVPFIYALLGEKYNHYLIDEFQDTSKLQWENLVPLIENALGSDYFNMAVGDGKQSIYRWRGGDVEIMEKGIASRIGHAGLTVGKLAKNYRSREQIVAFNNRFFGAVAEYFQPDNPLLFMIYRDVAQESGARPGGLVSLSLIEDAAHVPGGDRAVFDRVIEIIDGCRNRGFGYGDIAILVRENKEGQKIAAHLLEKRIPVVSPDSLVMSKIPLIRWLLDVLTFLSNPGEQISKASIIYYLSLSQKQGPLTPGQVGLALLGDDPWDLLPELAEFSRRKQYLIRLPVYEVIEEVIRIFRLDRALDFTTTGYLQAFLNVAADYSTKNSLDIASFLEWWTFNQEDFFLEVPETKPAVRIMTIHKAKGLEFPVVIIPYANWGHNLDKRLWLTADPPLPTRPSLTLPLPVNTHKLLQETHFQADYHQELEKVLIDNINLLYVAFTRAREGLYVIARHRGEADPYKNYRLLQELAVPFMTEVPEKPGHWIFGESTPAGKKQDKPTPITYLEAGILVSFRWYEKISIRRNSREFWKFDASFRTGRRSLGILVHRILSAIASPAEVDKAIERALFTGELALADKDALRLRLTEIFTDETVRGWFSPGRQVFSEAPIMTDTGILRPDRVLVDGDKAIIIDFKTGAREPSHLRQMQKYRQAVVSMGFSRVQGFLFYLDNREILPVPGEGDR